MGTHQARLVFFLISLVFVVYAIVFLLRPFPQDD
jgi:hypothetical protein